jgi:predicted RNA-binding Zn ribbon-like protein
VYYVYDRYMIRCAMTMKVSTKSEKFLWVGNDPAIDFVNTLIVQEGREVDLLAKPGDLLDWLRDSESLIERSLSDIERRLGKSQLEQALACAKDYRKTLKTALQRVSERGTVGKHALEETNRFLQEPRMIFALSDTEQGSQLLQKWTVGQPEDVLRPIALDFARLITDHDLSRIRKCQNPECVLFFLDTSKSGTRAWCSMNICGNKLRVAAFRKRQEGRQ